jgi:hypothetical protein
MSTATLELQATTGHSSSTAFYQQDEGLQETREHASFCKSDPFSHTKRCIIFTSLLFLG